MKLLSAAVRSGVPAALLAMSLSGCGGDSSTVSVSTKSRNMAPVVLQASQDAAVNGIAALGLDLLSQKDGNALVSPFSASLSLARLQAGANGETATALSSLTRLTGAPDQIYPALNRLSLGIDNSLAAASLDAATSGTFSHAWSQARYGYRMSYLDLLAEHFGIKPTIVDFDRANEEASQSLLEWVRQTTGLMPQFHPYNDTRFLLGDAIRLNASWGITFDPSLTVTGDFELLDQWRVVPAPFMRWSGIAPYTSGEGYAAMALPLQGNQQFLVVLPDSGRFAEIQASLTPERLNSIAAVLAPTAVNLAMPKFSMGQTMQIDVGIASTQNLADFSGIDGSRDLYVSNTSHHTTLSVAEEGLRARSTTLIDLQDALPATWTDYSSFDLTQDGSTSAPTTAVVLGRPFIFAVRDSATGTILFLARLMSPQPE